MTVLQALRAHRGTPVYRSDLARMTDLPDRTVRQEIADLAARGYPIVHHERGGYYLTDDPLDVEREAAQLASRIRSLAARLTGYRQAARRLRGERQGRLFDAA